MPLLDKHSHDIDSLKKSLDSFKIDVLREQKEERFRHDELSNMLKATTILAQ